MTSFYRYIRPVRFDESRLEFNTLPRGGVCLRFDENKWGVLTFSYARCMDEDLFNKSVARKIADQRMLDLQTDEDLLEAASIPYTSDQAEVLVRYVIELCSGKTLKNQPRSIIANYLSIEWLGLADQLRRIVLSNERERQKSAAFITAAHALELANAYREMTHAAPCR